MWIGKCVLPENEIVCHLEALQVLTAAVAQVIAVAGFVGAIYISADVTYGIQNIKVSVSHWWSNNVTQLREMSSRPYHNRPFLSGYAQHSG